MSEPFFGSVASAPIWPGGPYSGFGPFQTPIGLGSRPVGIGEGFASSYLPQTGPPMLGQAFPVAGSFGLPSPGYASTSQPYGPGGGMMTGPPAGSTFGQPGQSQGIPGMPAISATPGGYPAFGGFEVPTGIAVAALVAGVAMRRGQPFGPTNDHEIEEFIYDALDLLPSTNDVEVRAEGGRVTLTGLVQHKRLKHDIGEIPWATPGVNDVVNNLVITARRRTRGVGRETESPTTATGEGRRK
jgi:BON domain